jgi:hypothetical protein
MIVISIGRIDNILLLLGPPGKDGQDGTPGTFGQAGQGYTLVKCKWFSNWI